MNCMIVKYKKKTIEIAATFLDFSVILFIYSELFYSFELYTLDTSDNQT